MAESADAHGSGPCESNFMEVQVLLSAPDRVSDVKLALFFYVKNHFHASFIVLRLNA